MPALHDETSERSSMWLFTPKCLTPSLSHHRFLFFVFFPFPRQHLQAHTPHNHTHTYITCTLCLTLKLSSPWLCRRDNSLHRGDRLRQARLATYTEVWIYVSHYSVNWTVCSNCSFSEYTEKHAIGTAWAHFWHLFWKAFKVALSRSRSTRQAGCFLASFASLSCLTFMG